MKTLCTLLLLFTTFPFTLSAETFEAWNLDELVHSDLKPYLQMMPSFDLTLDNLGFVRGVAVPAPESLPKDSSVDVRVDDREFADSQGPCSRHGRQCWRRDCGRIDSEGPRQEGTGNTLSGAVLPSHQIADHRVPGRSMALFSWKCYLGGLSGDVPVYASPAMEQDLSGLPPTYMMTGELDPFRDETITYAQRLMAAKVPVELHVVPGAYHAFDLVQAAPISVKARNEYINAIKEALK